MILLGQAQGWHCSPVPPESSVCALDPELPELHHSNEHSGQELALKKSHGRLSQAGCAPSRLTPVRRWRRVDWEPAGDIQFLSVVLLGSQMSRGLFTVPRPPQLLLLQGSERESKHRFRTSQSYSFRAAESLFRQGT